MITQLQLDELLVVLLRRGTFGGSFPNAYTPVPVGGVYTSLELTEMAQIGQLMQRAYRANLLQKIRTNSPKASITDDGWKRLYELQQEAYGKVSRGEALRPFEQIIGGDETRELYEEIIRRHMPLAALESYSTTVAPRAAHETVATAPLADMTDEQREAIFQRRAEDGTQVHLAVQNLAKLWSAEKGVDYSAITTYLEPVEIIRADYETMFKGADIYALRELKTRMSTAGEFAPTTLRDMGETREIGKITPGVTPGSGLDMIKEGLKVSGFGDIARKAGYPSDMTMGAVWKDMRAKAKAAGISSHAPLGEIEEGTLNYDGFNLIAKRHLGQFEGREVIVYFSVPSDYDEDDTENFKAWVEKVSARLFSKDDWGRLIGELPTVDFIDARLKEEAETPTFVTLTRAALVAREACFRVLKDERAGYTYQREGHLEITGNVEIDPVEFSRYMLGETQSAKRGWWTLAKFLASILLGSGLAAAIFGYAAHKAGVF